MFQGWPPLPGPSAPQGRKGSCRKREVGMKKKAKVIALILIEVTCATS